MITRRNAGWLFIAFVIIGSLFLGERVAVTLGKNLVAPEVLNQKAIIVIFLSAGLSMFVANLIKIPQSTSLVTVASIAGVGAYYQKINVETFMYLLPFWIVLPVISYGLTCVLTSYVYPPRKLNFWVYERFANHEKKLKAFVIFSSCYSAFSVGTNNVANVVGPLLGTKISVITALVLFGFFYGLGAFVFNGPLKTMSQKIVPLGLLTATIISLVSGTLMIVASSLGIPQSFVMLQMGAIFAVSSLKHGQDSTFEHPLTRKTLYTWTINPVLTFFTSWLLAWIVI